MPRRPSAGDRITLLFQVNGVPYTDVTTVGRVGTSGIIADRSTNNLDPSAAVGVEVTALFVSEDRLLRWPMRIEAVLPSSYYLVSLAEPGVGQRREFVRADVPLAVTLWPAEGPPIEITAPVDLSASGFRVAGGPDLEDGIEVAVQIAVSADAEPIGGRARVVRGSRDTSAQALACEFIELASADEARLVELVFRVRAAALARRIAD